jgi:hypothetical protein
MKRIALAVLALAAFCAPAFATDPAAPKTCKATSDIPQFQIPEFQRVCGLHIRTVTLNGSHALATYTVSDDRDYHGHEIAGTPFSQALAAAAQDAHGRLYDLFPMERFEYRLKDSRDRPVCAFRFIGQNSAPVAGWCLDHVED